MKHAVTVRAIAIVLALAAGPAGAADLYWSGTGTWDTVTANWGASSGGPYSAATWNNATPDSAVFEGMAGTITLGEAITAGGLRFDTTGYILTNGANTLTFGAADTAITFGKSTVAAASISGAVDGTGNVTVASRFLSAGTLTLNGTSTNGWSGATTVNTGIRLEMSGNANNQALLSTTGITLNGGTIGIGNSTTGIGGPQAVLNRINDSATITSYGGAIAYDVNNSSANSETVGTLDLISGPFSLTEAYSLSSGTSTFIFSGISRTGAVNTSVFTLQAKNSAFKAGTISTGHRVVVGDVSSNTPAGQIVAPWFTTLYANQSAADYIVYSNGGSGSTNYAIPAAIAASTEDTWTNAPDAYTLNGAATLTGTRTVAALRYSGIAQALALASSNLESYGLLNGGTGLLTVSGTGALTTPAGGGNLYLTPGAAAITVSAPIHDNGVVTLVKSGANTLTLSATNSTYSGGTVLNAGTLATTDDTNLGSGGGITVNGTATWNMGGAVLITYNRSLTVNGGAALSLASGNNGKIITGVLSGNGQLINSSTTGFDFNNPGNTFTGTVNSGYAMSFAGLGDSSNPINFSGGSFTWTGGAKTFALRPFTLNAAGTASMNSSGSGALTIQQPLAITGAAGARTLTLGGTYGASANTFAGNITDGPGSVVSLTKGSGNCIWALSGINTYTGATTLSYVDDNGILIFQGMQALSPSTSLNQNQGGLNQRAGTIKILDDSATPASRSAVNLNFSNIEGVGTGDLRHWMRAFVGNNSTANGGTSSSTQTGSTIQVGNLNLTEGAVASTGGGLWLTGANGYKLQIADVNVTPQVASALGWQATLRADAPLTVTGTVRQAIDAAVGSSTTLQLEGSAAGSLISGNILNSAGGQLMNVTKASTGDWTLSGTNTYTGTTVINGGMLRVSGVLSTGAVSVTAGHLAGTGTVGGAVTLSGTGGIDLRDGVVGTLTLGSLNINGAAGANNLYFDLGTSSNGTDKIVVNGNTTMATSGAGAIIWNQLSGTRIDTGAYDLISATGTMEPASKFTLSPAAAFGNTFSLTGTASNLQVVVAAAPPGPTVLFWKGGADTNWSTVGNWAADVTGTPAGGAPGYNTDVGLYATGAVSLTTGALDADFDINSLTYGPNATANTTIGGTTRTLVLEAAAGDGITVNTPTTNSPAHTIAAKVGLASSQTWTVNSNAALTVTGAISDFGGGYSLTKAGAGTLTLNGLNTYSGATVVNAGTLAVLHVSLGNSTVANVLGMSSAAAANLVLNPGTTLKFVISGDQFTSTDREFTINGTAPGDSATLDSSGAGNKGVGFTSTASPAYGAPNQTRTLILAGTHQAAGISLQQVNKLAANMADNGTGAVSLTKNGTGSWSLTGANTYTGTTTVNGGVLRLQSATAVPGGLGATGGLSGLTLNGGVVGLEAGDIRRNVGPGSDQFQITGGASGFGAYGAARNVVVNNDSDTELVWGTATFNPSALVLNDGTGGQALTFANKLDLAGATAVIAVYGNTATVPNVIRSSSGTGGLTKTGAGTLVLAGVNPYNGVTTVEQGTLSINAIRDFGVAGPLGAPASGATQLGAGGNSGTLLYTGPGEAANRTVQIGDATPASTGGGVITSSGSGALTFTAGVFNPTIAGITATRVLTLGGTNVVGSNQIQGVIQDHNGTTGKVSVVKADASTWVLSGTNTYSGATTISGGRLEIGGAGVLGGGAYAASIANSAEFRVNSTAAQTLSGVISGTGGLVKDNTGALTLVGTNTYSGATTIKGGTLWGVTGGSCSNSAVTVTNAPGNVAALGVRATDSARQWTCKSLALNADGGGAQLQFTYDVAPSTNLAPLKITGNLTFDGVPQVVVHSADLAGGMYPLLVVGGAAPTVVPSVSAPESGTSVLRWGGTDNKTLFIVQLNGTLLIVR